MLPLAVLTEDTNHQQVDGPAVEKYYWKEIAQDTALQ